jgi:hypothetical protein
MKKTVAELRVGDTIIINPDGSARTVRSIRKAGSLTRLAFDDGQVRLEPATASYTLTDFATRPEPRTHSVAIELGKFGRAYVYVTPGTMCYRDWYTVHKPAASFVSLDDAQEWLVRVIGYEARDHEVFRYPI